MCEDAKKDANINSSNFAYCITVLLSQKLLQTFSNPIQIIWLKKH